MGTPVGMRYTRAPPTVEDRFSLDQVLQLVVERVANLPLSEARGYTSSPPGFPSCPQ